MGGVISVPGHRLVDREDRMIEKLADHPRPGVAEDRDAWVNRS